ncbi:MAG: hypothetical protein ACYCXW_08475 [Solirubrobacteraceae bacterium]
MACAVLTAACGGSTAGASGAGTTAGGATGGTSADSNLPLKFAQCMRSHGVSNFPDPSDGAIQIGGSGIDPSSPAFQRAQNACAKYSPKGALSRRAPTAAEKAAALTFSECMRAHGAPTFPDPTYGNPPAHPSGNAAFLAIRGALYSLPAGLNPRSPAFQHAARACGLRPPTGAKVSPAR